MICLIFPSPSQSVLIGQLQAHAKLSAFEYENKASRKSNKGTKRLIWSSFKVTRLSTLAPPKQRASSVSTDK